MHSYIIANADEYINMNGCQCSHSTQSCSKKPTKCSVTEQLFLQLLNIPQTMPTQSTNATWLQSSTPVTKVASEQLLLPQTPSCITALSTKQDSHQMHHDCTPTPHSSDLLMTSQGNGPSSKQCIITVHYTTGPAPLLHHSLHVTQSSATPAILGPCNPAPPALLTHWQVAGEWSSSAFPSSTNTAPTHSQQLDLACVSQVCNGFDCPALQFWIVSQNSGYLLLVQ